MYTGCAGFCNFRSKQVHPTKGLDATFSHLKHAELQLTNSSGISGWENLLLLLPNLSGRNSPKEAKFHMKLPVKGAEIHLGKELWLSNSHIHKNHLMSLLK